MNKHTHNYVAQETNAFNATRKTIDIAKFGTRKTKHMRTFQRERTTETNAHSGTGALRAKKTAHPRNKQNQPPRHNFHTIMSPGRKSRWEEGTNRRLNPAPSPTLGQWRGRVTTPRVDHPPASFLFCAGGFRAFTRAFPFPGRRFYDEARRWLGRRLELRMNIPRVYRYETHIVLV